MFTERFQFNPVKIFRHPERVSEWLTTEDAIPVVSEIDPTNLCPLKCPWCSSGDAIKYAPKASLTLAEMRDCLVKLKNFGVKAVTFTGGGEPLANTSTPDAVEFARSIGLDVGFITNGVLLTERRAKVILQNCIWVRVSLDSTNFKHWQSWHRGTEQQLKRSLKAVHLLAQQKEELQSDCTVGIQFVLSGVNWQSIPDFAKFAIEAKVDYVQFTPMTFHEPEKQQLVAEKFKDMIGLLSVVTEDYKHQTRTKIIPTWHKFFDMASPETNFNRRYTKCYGHAFTTAVGATGDVWLCCHMRGHPEFSLGNLLEQSMEEIWASPKRQAAIEAIDLSVCQPCCRNNEINKFLFALRDEVRHENFL